MKCQTLISGGVRGTLPWMAPELLNGSSSLVSEKVCALILIVRLFLMLVCLAISGIHISVLIALLLQVDVFSFGIVLWELLTGEEPYADLHYGAIIGNVLVLT